ncbi:MAG: hypothetical protein WKG07_09570 [Hymenobacter sp.]
MDAAPAESDVARPLRAPRSIACWPSRRIAVPKFPRPRPYPLAARPRASQACRTSSPAGSGHRGPTPLFVLSPSLTEYAAAGRPAQHRGQPAQRAPHASWRRARLRRPPGKPPLSSSSTAAQKPVGQQSWR